MAVRDHDNDQPGGSPGPATDRTGAPVLDPSPNVLDWVEAAIKRQDDLRFAESEHIREIIAIRSANEDKMRAAQDAHAHTRADYEEKLRDKESARIDAIRAVDVGAGNRAAEVGAQAAAALAAQLVATADASRASTAAAAAASVTSLSAALEPIQKDIRDLRDAQSRGQGGKEHVVEATSENRDAVLLEQARLQAGQSRMQLWGLVIAALLFAVSFYAITHHTAAGTPAPAVTVTVQATPTP
jgi:hypothetical protein